MSKEKSVSKKLAQKATPEYPNFLADVLATAITARIPDLESHVRALTSQMPQGPIPHCSDCGRPMTEH